MHQPLPPSPSLPPSIPPFPPLRQRHCRGGVVRQKPIVADAADSGCLRLSQRPRRCRHPASASGASRWIGACRYGRRSGRAAPPCALTQLLACTRSFRRGCSRRGGSCLCGGGTSPPATTRGSPRRTSSSSPMRLPRPSDMRSLAPMRAATLQMARAVGRSPYTSRHGGAGGRHTSQNVLGAQEFCGGRACCFQEKSSMVHWSWH